MNSRFLIGVILSILSGVLLSLSFLQIGLGFFMWFALVPVMIADFKLARNRWQFGIFFAIMIIIWLETYWWVLPVTWVKIAPPFVGIIVVMAVSPLKRILEWHNYCLFIPLSAVAGVTIDLLNSFTPTGNISSFATTQSTYPLVIQIASLFGIHSITFLLISINALISLIIIKFTVLRKYKWQIIGSLTLLFLSLLLGIIHLNYLAEKSVPVAAVQEGTDDPFSKDAFSKPIDKAALMGARLVVLPECSYLIDSGLSFEDYAGTWKSLAARNNIYLIAPYGLFYGIPEMDLAINRNMAVLVSPDGRISIPYVKHHIVKILGEDWESGITYPVFATKIGELGIMICYDGYYPDVARKLAAQGASLIAMPSNGVTPGLSRRISTAVIPFRAVENGVGIVISDRLGGAMIIDPFGRILKQAPKESDAIIKDNLPVNKYQTFYTQYGYVFPYLCLILFVIIFIQTIPYQISSFDIKQCDP